MNPRRYTPAQLAGLARGAAALARFERLERGLPPDEPCACDDPPRRVRPVLRGVTAEERRFLAEGPPAPPPPAVRRVTLADAKTAGAPWLKRLTASGHRPHPVDPKRRPVWNGGDTYHDLVASGGRL